MASISMDISPWASRLLGAFHKNGIDELWNGSATSSTTVALTVAAILITIYLITLHQSVQYDDGLPVLNRSFSLEPSVFARIRWATQSMSILDEANCKYNGVPFRLARGDTDLTVLPAEFVQELNRLPQDALSSRLSHASTLLGHLNGMNVVLKTNRHVKMLLNRITPAMPMLVKPIRIRIQETITQEFPSSTAGWATVHPIEKIVLSISRGVSLLLFGAPESDVPELYETLSKHTQNVFGVGFTMRLVPRFLQSALVWLLPAKWRLERTWKILRRYVHSIVQRRVTEQLAGRPSNMDLISCMTSDEKTPEIADAELLTGLMGSTSAGATYSTTALIFGVLIDLTAHPHFLEIMRVEIRDVDEAVNGNWDFEAFNRLEKLDSAMKETARCMPPTLLNYSRVVLKDFTLSNGLELRKGQRLCISGRGRVTDPSWFERPQEYDALRAYRQDLQDHRNRPFSSSLSDDFRWGAGRWACPGRYLATIMAKMILVKLLDEYEFRFAGGQQPKKSLLHEFLFFYPDAELEVRARAQNLGIVYD